MDEFKTLLRLLEEELQVQEKLLKLLTSERAAIAKLDQMAMERSAAQKDKLLGQSSQLESERTAIVERIAPTGRRKERAKLADLLTKCPSPALAEQLKKTGATLKQSAQATRELNAANTDLIRHTLRIISSTVAIIRAAPGAEAKTYSDKGSLKKNREVLSSYRDRVIG